MQHRITNWSVPRVRPEGKRKKQPSSGRTQMTYRIPAYRVQLVRDGSGRAPHRRCQTAAQAVEVFRDYVGDADREHFLAIYLDALDRLIGLNEVAIGTINLLHVTAREIFKPAILCNANRIILLHNHPSGEPAPSPEDLVVCHSVHDG
jgi:DNA repair protein RadC